MKRTILVIDDNEDIRDIARISIEVVGGWTLLEAASGLEGLAVAEREQPDAILLDYMMPELDGPATFAVLQENQSTRSIPVIFLTAKESFEGGAGTISKPFDPMNLHTQVATILNWGE